jgi:hypothetical protein
MWMNELNIWLPLMLAATGETLFGTLFTFLAWAEVIYGLVNALVLGADSEFEFGGWPILSPLSH